MSGGKMDFEKLQKWEEECTAKHGWYAHCVFDYEDMPFDFNVHTHKVSENFGHFDLEIVCPLEPKIAMGILHNIVDLIKEGRKFIPGQRYSDILTNGYSVEFAMSAEDRRAVLRVIIPDKNDCTDETADEPFCRQWENLGVLSEWN